MNKTYRKMSNEEFVKELMNFSPYGALSQSFIIQAIEFYCQEVISQEDKLIRQEEEAEKKGKISLISKKAWVNIAKDINAKLKLKYEYK